MAEYTLTFDGKLARRVGVGAVGMIAALFVAWTAAYAAGVWPWLGYAWLTRSSFGAGPIGVIGEDRTGTAIGPSMLVFFKGQEIVVDYHADIRAGSLRFYVYELAKTGQAAGVSHYVTETGTGSWTYRVPRTAVYVVHIEPSVVRGAGRGYDMSYRVWWGARWAS